MQQSRLTFWQPRMFLRRAMNHPRWGWGQLCRHSQPPSPSLVICPLFSPVKEIVSWGLRHSKPPLFNLNIFLFLSPVGERASRGFVIVLNNKPQIVINYNIYSLRNVRMYSILECSQDWNIQGFQRDVVVIENWRVYRYSRAFWELAVQTCKGKYKRRTISSKVLKNEARYRSIKSILLNRF